MITSNYRHSRKASPNYRLAIFTVAVITLAGCATHDVKHEEVTSKSINSVAGNSETQFNKKYNIAITTLKQNNYTEAEKLFSELSSEQPNNDGPYCNLAIIYFKANDYDNALKLVSHAIELNKNNYQAYNLRAQINLKLGRVINAKDDYLKATKINPKYINAQYNLALLYDIYLQDLQNAIKHYEIYLSLINKPDERTQEWLNHLKGSISNG